ncbi:MAG: 2-C-methyl-D-erythritol 2,4-cyclodiphosphate synthase [Candidatus Omnitrophota bacterium]|jgi:2-C-methyl-D-erythritol 2,4-cyclodiphosphate synthase|nr:2-C-methyl-D-erythritol 2,4-cyclodiphosphate synthase [Candidatus Omnitrophota bacterium]MDD5518473.1 2-C-methyl-D-erythritol 2,4-cyclodiphosphate synthase [Candidatus Omnitrophota bacterium]
MENRIGIGYDIHRLVDGRELFIGGIEIPYIKGLLGHSDADVLIHAICDALLGAIAGGDIGKLFPDTNPEYRGIRSRELLKIVLELVRKKGYKITNVDTVIIAEEPNLSAFKNRIQENLSKIMKIDKNCVGIKAKTNEGLGALGSKEGIACYAVVLVRKENLL